MGFQFQGLGLGGVAVGGADQPQVKLAAGEPVEHGVGLVHDLPFRLPHQMQLQPIAAQELGQDFGVAGVALGPAEVLLEPRALAAPPFKVSAVVLRPADRVHLGIDGFPSEPQ